MRQFNLIVSRATQRPSIPLRSETTFRCSPEPVAGPAPRKSRSRTVDLRSDCPGLEHMKRFGMAEMLSYILIAEAGVRQRCRSSAKHGVL